MHLEPLAVVTHEPATHEPSNVPHKIAEFATLLEGISGPRPRIGVLTAQKYMKSALEELGKEYDIVPITPDEGDWTQETVDYWVQFCKDNEIPCVVGFAQKDSWHHALINAGLGNATISPRAYLTAMNKYMQRTIEPNAFWFADIDPDSEQSDDALVAKVPENEWPVMLKNTSLSLGRGVFYCDSPARMKEILVRYRENIALQAEIKKTNDSITARMSEEEQAAAGAVPPFIAEHCVDMTKGWVEYCYEGCVSESGEQVHYALTEEVYMDDGSGLAYVCPPVSYKNADIGALEAYLTRYMDGLIAQGYVRQFFNVEFWVNTSGNKPEFCFCEINPRCAHGFHYGYLYSSGHNLYRDVFECVLNDRKPENTPWDSWKAGQGKVSVQVLINVKGCEGMAVSDVLDLDYLNTIESTGSASLVRHVKADDYVLTADDASAAAGTTLKQIWIQCDNHAEAAAKEMAVRRALYKIKQDDAYPTFWTELAASYSGSLGNLERKDCA